MIVWASTGLYVMVLLFQIGVVGPVVFILTAAGLLSAVLVPLLTRWAEREAL